MKTEHPDAILVWFGTNPSSEDYLGLGIDDGLVKVGWVWFGINPSSEDYLGLV